jgi:putative ABC transport system ATP-binding protein
MNEIIISCKNIHKFYSEGESSVHALRGVMLDIHSGEHVAIMGRSGSGKSTLLNILGCLDVASQGSYLFLNTEVKNLSDDELSQLRGKKIGFIFQAFHLLPHFHLLENVALPLFYQNYSRTERFEKAKQALNIVGLSHRLHHFPNEISGGEKQRAAIARAIVHNPSVLFADEPTGNLDSTLKNEILDHLCQLNEKLGITLIVITHDAETAKRAKRILYFSDGNIIKEEVLK